MKTITRAYNFFSEIDEELQKDVFSDKNSPENPALKISVVISTYNRGRLINRALGALINHNIPRNLFEIIVINDGSTDETGQKVKNFIQENPSFNIKLITLKQNRGSSYGGNRGILHARTDLIAITDDDCIVPPDWLFGFIKAFETHPDIIAAGGWKKPYRDNGMTPSHYDTFMFWRRLPHMKTERKSVEMNPFNNCGDTANVCYRKQALLDCGGFNHSLRTFNDWELKIRLHKLGKPLFYHPVFIPHEADLTLKKFVRYWLCLGNDCFLISKIHPQEPVFNTSLTAACKRTAHGISHIFKAGEDEIFQKTAPQTSLYIFFEIVINICLWLGKYIT